MLNHTLSILHHIFCCFFIGSSVLHQVSLQLSLIINGGPFQAKGTWPSGSMYVVGRSRQENFSLSLGSTAAAQDSTQASQLEFTWHHKAPHYQLFVLPILLKLVELGINFIPCENMQLFCALFHKQVDGWKTPLFLHQTSNLPINSLFVLKVLEKQMDEKSLVWT